MGEVQARACSHNLRPERLDDEYEVDERGEHDIERVVATEDPPEALEPAEEPLDLGSSPVQRLVVTPRVKPSTFRDEMRRPTPGGVGVTPRGAPGRENGLGAQRTAVDLVKGRADIPERTIGMNVGDRYSHVCVLDAAGEIRQEGGIWPRTPALQRWFEGKGAEARVVLEVGPHSPWISRLAAGAGCEVLVANPRKLRMIYENDCKSGQADAEYLARVGRMDPELLVPIEHRGRKAQADLAVVRSRAQQVEARTELINHARSTVKALGGQLPKCSTKSFHRKGEEHVPEDLQPAPLPTIDPIDELTRQIRTMERWIEDLSETVYPETALLRQIDGVGSITALCYVLTLERPERFSKSRSVWPCLGLVRRTHDSGESSPALRITKAGDTLLRKLLVQAAHYILGPFGPECDLRRWGQKLEARGGPGARKRAIVAVARKLAVLLHRLWITGVVCDPLHQQKQATVDETDDVDGRELPESTRDARAAA